MASKISFVVKLKDLVKPEDIKGMTKNAKENVNKKIGDIIVDKILEDTGNRRSAVTGQQWKGLSKAYSKIKSKTALPIANLDLHGDMLSSLKPRPREDHVEVGIFNTKQAKKADGHTGHGVFGVSDLPRRRFMPLNNGKLRSGIMKELAREAKQIVANAPKRAKPTTDTSASSDAKFALTRGE